MKKQYEKPVLLMESFQLDVGVAACDGIEAIPIHKSEMECHFDAGDMIYFAAENASCNYDPVNPNEWGDSECYHGYNSGGITFFSS